MPATNAQTPTTSAPAQSPPIDVDHLRTITFDDQKLEWEVLALFGERASAALIAIEQSESAKDREEAAHRLVGAARAIGANDLANAAQEIEEAETMTAELVASLSRATAAVISFLEVRMSRRTPQSEAG